MLESIKNSDVHSSSELDVALHEGDCEESHEEIITLKATQLLTKWGFDDGDLLSEISYDIGIDSHELLIWLVVKHLAPLIVPRVGIYSIMTSHNPIRIDQIDGIKINNYTTSHDLENNTQFKWLNTIAAKINYLQIAKIAHELITKYNGKAPVKSINIISLIQLNEMPGAWPNNNSWEYSIQ